MTNIQKLAAEWRTARLLYPLYAALAREFVIDVPSCGDLEAGVETPPQESVELARQWFKDMDERIQVHQLRQFLQTTNLTSDEGLRSLLEHHLQKQDQYGKRPRQDRLPAGAIFLALRSFTGGRHRR